MFFFLNYFRLPFFSHSLVVVENYYFQFLFISENQIILLAKSTPPCPLAWNGFTFQKKTKTKKLEWLLSLFLKDAHHRETEKYQPVQSRYSTLTLVYTSSVPDILRRRAKALLKKLLSFFLRDRRLMGRGDDLITSLSFPYYSTVSLLHL